MSRISADKLYGIWAGVTMSWDENDCFDEVSYRTNIERMCHTGVHSILNLSLHQGSKPLCISLGVFYGG